MPIENIEEMPTSEITIAGIILSVPAPFTEGHVLRTNEASVLNQTYAENLRNNFATKVKAAVKAAEENSSELNLPELQLELNEYTRSYDFGVRQSSGTRLVVDPITKQALLLAKEEVKTALQAAGYKLKDVGVAKINELTNSTLEANPILMERAEQILAIKAMEGALSLELDL